MYNFVRMTSGSGHIRVVAAVIERDGAYFITQRRATAVLAGLWEFPGGKVESGETDELALKREVSERVGVDIEVNEQMAQRTHRYDRYTVNLILYRASIRPGQEPRALRVADFKWVASSEFENYQFPAADQHTMDLLLGIER
jgi:mutator protein MutT